MILKETTGTLNITLLDFIVNHKLFFKIRNLPGAEENDNFKKRIYIFAHDMVPEELKNSWEMEHRLEKMENDSCESYYYEGFDADLTEDWSNNYDDFESDTFLDDGRDEAYVPAYSDPEKPDLPDKVDENGRSCWKYYDINQDTFLPPLPHDLITIEESDLKADDEPKDILSDSYVENDLDDVFFHNMIMQIYSGTFEILKLAFQKQSD